MRSNSRWLVRLFPLTTAAFSAAALSVFPARAEFEWANPVPTGADLQAICVDPAGVGYAVGDFGTTLRSEDQGLSWSRLSTLEAAAPHFFDLLALAPGELLAAGSAPGLHRSLDGGETWTPVANPANTTLRNLFQLDSATIFAVGEQGRVIRSTDGGITFESLTALGSQLVDQFWLSDQVGYVIGPNKLRRTTNGGATWATIPGLSESGIGFPGDIQFPSPTEGRILVDFAIYRSSNGGATWSTQSLPFPNAPIYLEEALFLDSGSFLVATEAEGAELWRTTNDGATWTRTLQRDGTRGITDLLRWPDGAISAVSSDGDLLRSTDQGLSWSDFTQLAGPRSREDLSKVDLLPSGLGFAGGWGQIWLQTTDGGASWFDPPTTPGLRGTFALTLRDTALFLAGGSDTPGKSEVRRSTDGGATWTNHPISPGYVGYPQAFAAFPDGVCFVGLYGGTSVNFIYRSTDHGATWNPRGSGYPASARVNGLDFLDPTRGWVFGGDFGTPVLYRTTDGGATWSPAAQGGLLLSSIRDGHWFSETEAVIVGDNRIQRTTNGGVLWQTVHVGGSFEFLDFDGPIGVAGGSSGQVWRTSDSGLTWQGSDVPAANFWTDAAVVPAGYVTVGSANSVMRFLDAPTSVPEVASLSPLLWPNPIRSDAPFLRLSTPGSAPFRSGTLLWFDPAGRELARQELAPPSLGADELRIALPRLEPGVHLLELRAPDGRRARGKLTVIR